MGGMKHLLVGATMFWAIAASAPISAQSLPIDPAARTADSAVGEVGQRQTVKNDASNIEVPRRTSNRIESRIENRIQNRIDRNYSVLNNASSQLKQAENQARNVSEGKRPR